MIRHTKGPWMRVGESVENADGVVIADCALSSGDITEREGNAAIMAAALEMHAALARLVDGDGIGATECYCNEVARGPYECAICAGKAALSKAGVPE